MQEKRTRSKCAVCGADLSANRHYCGTACRLLAERRRGEYRRGLIDEYRAQHNGFPPGDTLDDLPIPDGVYSAKMTGEERAFLIRLCRRGTIDKMQLQTVIDRLT